MPRIGTREKLLMFGAAMGIAVAGAARAEPRASGTDFLILAQQQQNDADQEEQKRRQRRQPEQQQQPQQRQEHQQRQQQEQPRDNNRAQQEEERRRQEQRQRAQQQQIEQQRQRERAQQQQQQIEQQRQRERAQQQQQQIEQQRQRERAQQQQQQIEQQRQREKAQQDQQRQNEQQRQHEKAQQDQQRQGDQQRQRDKAQQDQQRQGDQQRQRDKAQQEQRDQPQRKDLDRAQTDKDQQRRGPQEQTGQKGPDRRDAGRDQHRDEIRKRVEERRRIEGEQARKPDQRALPKEATEARKISREDLEERRRARQQFTRERLKDITGQRHERRENGRVIIEEPDARRIVRERGRIIIHHDESERLRSSARNVVQERRSGGGSRMIITRPNGVQIITIEDGDGRLLRRIKRYPNGREVILINNEYRGKHRFRDEDRYSFGYFVSLPAFVLGIPHNEYYVDLDDADEYEIEDVLTAPPLNGFEGDYTLDEIRYSPDIRKRIRKLDLNSITFEFGSWEVRPNQVDSLALVAKVMLRIIDDNPDEVFMIAGFTDAVGSDEDNLSLSDRRAEAVARVLTDEFGVPPENLVTQGYGESELLVETQGPDERNRRVEVMRITPVLAQKDR